MKLRVEFEPMGGYDCMSDAFIIYDGAQRVATIDLRDFDALMTGAGADIHAVRLAGEKRALEYALMFANLKGIN